MIDISYTAKEVLTGESCLQDSRRFSMNQHTTDNTICCEHEQMSE